MFGLFKKLAATGANDVIGKDLGRIDSVTKGLGTQAAKYVRSGEGADVLATLSNTAIAPNLLNPLPYGNQRDDIYMARCKFLLDCTPYDTGLMARYAEVLGAIYQGQTYNRKRTGSATADFRLREFFADAFFATPAQSNRWPLQARAAKVTGLTPDAIALLGKGNVATREGMAGLLGKLGTDSAIAALATHLETEKTAPQPRQHRKHAGHAKRRCSPNAPRRPAARNRE